MKYNRNAKIKYALDGTPDYPYRGVYYKIVPSEIPFLARLFNPWRAVFRSYKTLPGTGYLFDTKQFHMLQSTVKTYGDMCDFLSKEIEKIKKNNEEGRKRLDKDISEGKEWPDTELSSI